MKAILIPSLLAAASLPGLHAQGAFAHSTGIYAIAGTSGAGLGITQKLADFWTVRGEYSTYSLSRSFTADNIDYDGTFKLRSAALYADFRPFAGAFRITGGVSFLTPKVDATATSSGTYTINGHSYSAAGEYIKGTVKYPSAMPYLGIGWGLRPDGKSGLLVGFDLGAFIGSPTTTMTYSPGLVSAVPQADRDSQEQSFKDKVAKVSFFPVVKLGVGYAF